MVMFFSPKKTRIYKLHMKSRSQKKKKKKHSTTQIAIQEGLSIWEGQGLLQSRNEVEEAISTAPTELVPEANNTVHEHHHGVVIVILLDIDGCNVLITIATRFYIHMHFWGFQIDLFSDLGREVARSLTDYVTTYLFSQSVFTLSTPYADYGLTLSFSALIIF